MVVTIAKGQRKARKPHKCFHCYRCIGVGETYGFETNKYDDVYTIAFHLDCEAMAVAFIDLLDWWEPDDGFAPLRNNLIDSEEYLEMLEFFRGRFPHVVCRMELSDQLLRFK